MWRNMYSTNIRRYFKPRHWSRGLVDFTVATAKSEQALSIQKRKHVPVLLRETISALNVRPDKTFVDMTFGAGGHTREILKRGAKVVAIDRDPSVESIATEFKEEFGSRFDFRVAKFTEIRNVLADAGVPAGSVSGILVDCGCSSMQMDSARGFSSSKPNSPFDMRMNPADPQGPTAAQLVNHLSAESLAKIFKTYGEEKYSRKIADAIISYRYEMKQIRTIGEFCQVVEAAFAPSHFRTDMIGRQVNLATKAIMGLRIFVNDELNQLNRGLHLMYDILHNEGQAVVISFHSLEDRIVKRHFSGVDMDEPVSHTIAQKYRNAGAWHKPTEMRPKWISIFKDVVTPSEDEIEQNPRSRSAKLRGAVKVQI